jgi:hypothetical protein
MSRVFDDYALLRRSWIADGRRLVLAGEYAPISQVSQLNVMMYRREQRTLVDRRGRCDGGCSVELVENPQGELVCPLTWRPCPNRVLGSIVSLYSKVNG